LRCTAGVTGYHRIIAHLQRGDKERERDACAGGRALTSGGPATLASRTFQPTPLVHGKMGDRTSAGQLLPGASSGPVCPLALLPSTSCVHLVILRMVRSVCCVVQWAFCCADGRTVTQQGSGSESAESGALDWAQALVCFRRLVVWPPRPLLGCGPFSAAHPGSALRLGLQVFCRRQ
jgi:hypothetical protein